MAFTKNKDELMNRIDLAGQLESIDFKKEGVTSTDGTPYISFRGKIRTGATSVSSTSFRAFIKKKTVEPGKTSNYDKVKDWLSKVKAMVDVGEAEATYVTLIGSVTDEPYVKQDDNLSEYPSFNINIFGIQDESKPKEKHAWVDLEGSFLSLTEDTYGENNEKSSGNYKMNLVSKDFFGKTLQLKNIIVTPEIKQELEDNRCVEGVTATFNIDIVEESGPRQQEKAGKSGFSHRDYSSVEGPGRTVWKLSGYNNMYEDDESVHFLTTKTVNEMLRERKARIDQIRKEGYKGNASKGAAVNPTRAKAMASASFTSDDDLPF